jgi:hypothetical protein
MQNFKLHEKSSGWGEENWKQGRQESHFISDYKSVYKDYGFTRRLSAK